RHTRSKRDWSSDVCSSDLFFYNLAIERNVKDFLTGNEDLEVSAEAMDVFLEGDWRAWHDEQSFEQLQIEAEDGVKLNGYYLPARSEERRVGKECRSGW